MVELVNINTTSTEQKGLLKLRKMVHLTDYSEHKKQRKTCASLPVHAQPATLEVKPAKRATTPNICDPPQYTCTPTRLCAVTITVKLHLGK